MKILSKFESKSSRVKGLAFHPKLPWLLASLHNGTIQLWDYRMFVLIDRFEEHNGPVRTVAFHQSQPLFVSGGDDHKINVWNYQIKKLLFSLTGHMDYVRTVSFHHEYPWILSASDDQTIRIWNWQSRQSIAVLTGHSHYVMCAAFHPTEDLIASASLDQTIRVWDMSNLCKKYTSPHSQSIEEDIVRASSQPAQNDIFGSTDVVLKYNIESHDRGVNWVAWHPTKPLLASAGDDQAIKITKLLGTKYWTDGTAYGHSKNVSCVVYHPRQNLLMSVSEDKTLRVWDGAKYTQLLINERENDRYWILVAHPTMSLFATGHDSGVTIFKLDRERPAHTIYQDELFWIDTDKNINTLSLKAGSSGKVVGSLKKIGHKWNTVYSLSYNPAEKAILAVSGDNDRMYELVMLPREVGSESTESRTGEGDEAVWIARNRFAVLKKQTNSIEIRDLGNTLTRTVTVPKDILGISAAKPNIILLRYAISVKLFGIQKKLVISELAISGIKYTYWSLDGNYVALMGKQLIAIATKELKLVCETREPIRLKSAAWNEDGVLIYSTLDHLRYILPNGDKGIIKTLQDPLYLIQVRRSHAYGLDREARPRVVSIDPTDFKFKMALIKGDQKEMLRIIHNSDLVGQSIIAYLSKKGYPDVALNFVQDVKLRFELAIECGKIDIALETATSIDDPKVWQRLAKEAAYQGNHKIMELCYQKLKDFSSLSFLYLVTGNKVKLDKMTKIAEHRGDMISVFQNSLLLGNVSARVKLLRECGLDSLAYATAKLNGLTDEASNILAECGKSEEDVDLPSDSEALPPVPEVKRATYEENWPMKERQETAFERVLLENSELAEPAAALLNKDVVTVDAEDFEQDEEVQFADVDGGDDWDVDNELNLEDLDISKDEMKTTGGVSSAILSENEYWVRNSMLPAHHIAGGSFETAMQLLSRQLAVIRFEPLKARFTEIYEASRAFVPTAPLLPSLVVYNSKPLEKMVSTNLEPFVPRTVSSLEDVDIPEAYRLVKVNKLPQAVEKFRSILYVLNTASVSSKSEIERAEDLINTCTEYIVGLICELERRKQDSKSSKRALELASYFTNFKLQPTHRAIALRSAMVLAVQAKNFALASKFASELLEIQSSGQAAENARKIIATAERNPVDTITIDYDPQAEFTVCAATLTPIYKGANYVTSPFSNAKYLTEFKGSVCRVDLVSEIGGTATGRRFH